MTNAEKFKEVFGYKGEDFSSEINCPFNSEICGSKVCEDCISDWWQSEYQGEPTISLSVIEKIHDAIDNAEPDSYLENIYGRKFAISLTKEHVNEIIDNVVKECTHE